MSAKFKLSDDVINAALEKAIIMINSDNTRANLDKPFSNYSILLSDKEPRNVFYKFSNDDFQNVINLKDQYVFIVADRII